MNAHAMNSQFRFWWRWLVVMTVGLILFAASFIVLSDLMQQVYNTLLFPVTQAHTTFNTAASEYIRFVYIVLGAVMIGWGLSLLFTLAGPFKLGHRESWWAVVVSLTTWFVIDSALSVAMGFWPNAIINIVFFILYSIPLIAIRRHFQPGRLQMAV